MARNTDREVVLGFVAEAVNYLPQIRDGLAAFVADPSRLDKVEETYRLVHTITGASSMVGLDGLSHIASVLERAVEEVVAGRLPTDADHVALLHRLIDIIADYLGGVRDDTLFEPPLLEEAAHLRRLLHDLPEETPPELPPAGAADDLDWSALTPWDAAPGDEMPPLPGVGAEDVPPAPPAAEPVPGLAPDDVSPELLEVFALEAEDHLRTIGLGLPEFERNPSNKEVLQQVRRSTHTLKGAAGMVGFRNITQLAHRMEDVLDLLYEDGLTATPEVIKLLFASADALEDMSKGKADVSAVAALLGQYGPLLGAATPAAPAPAEPTEAAVPEEEADEHAAAATRSPTQFVRIPIERLDEMVNLVSELVIARGALEQRMADFLKQVAELRPSTERLRRVSYKLETQFEASALGGAGGSGGPPSLPLRPLRDFAAHGFDDLEMDRYTEFHLLSRELAETTNDVQTVGGDLAHVLGDFDSYLGRQARLSSEIEDKLMRLRMVPLATAAGRLHRTVRSTADALGKQAELVLEGEGTELDKGVLEAMADPLLHLLRNAVDHGIEMPEVRQARGKPAAGTIRLRACHEGSQVILRIQDDGAGLDPERVRSVALGRGLLSPAEAAQAPEAELFALVFQPGFSTAKQVSEISGRGVGLDVVKTHVHRLKGTITLESRPGGGATFTIRLPMTLAIIRSLLVKSRSQTFAIPLDSVRQILRVDRVDVAEVGGEAVLRVGETVYPVLALDRALSLKGPADETVRRPPVLILNTGERDVALVVDHLLGGREIVVKTLGTHLRRVPGVTGATLMGDGSVVLILNPAELSRPAGRQRSTRIANRPSGPAAPARGRDDLRVLIVDDSPSVRRVVSTLIKGAGWTALTAKDGLDALEQLHGAAAAPDLVLLDIEMPRMDGYEFLASLRGEEALRRLPVVMVTSRAGEKHRRKAFELGATGYMVKPYQDEAMLCLIRQLVSEARQAVPV